MEVTLENFLEFTGKYIDNILEPINHHTCMGFTNKTSFIQCKCKPKYGDFCGRHKKTNRRYDIFFKHFILSYNVFFFDTHPFIAALDDIACVNNSYWIFTVYFFYGLWKHFCESHIRGIRTCIAKDNKADIYWCCINSQRSAAL